MVNWNPNELSWTFIKKSKINIVILTAGEDTEKQDHLYIAGGIKNNKEAEETA